ncbi:(Fe-S)-binding protein [Flavobacteriales bacterium]|jgi:heterodisulfide reductase subunit C|nr:(Fe-S)-binding protein [Flavobacteriales bacterium]
MIQQIIFLLLFIGFTALFTVNIRQIKRNINLGREVDRSSNSRARWKEMIRVALGQSKMVSRPIAGFLHILIYVGFVIINIEVIEIIIDGIFGTHRVLSFLGPVYGFLIGSFEVLAALVLIACVFFLTRRNIMRIPRFLSKEMKGWPKTDANLILIFEVVLMFAFLLMNASDALLVAMNSAHYTVEFSNPISQFLVPFISHLSESNLIFIERASWWFHIVGILAFLNYLVVSKHLHIILAFPNTYYSNLEPKGKFENMDAVTNEVKKMLDPNIDPFAVTEEVAPERFGAKDVKDLSWIQLLNAYSCTECGRCTSECPANQTGKLLSPRKIMMDVRDRVELVGKGIKKEGESFNDGKSLLDSISKEELWACTSCNACTEACPINIDPLSIIVDLRRYLVMEESAAPMELNNIFANIENNGAPWQFSMSDRLNWKDE